LTDEEIMLLVGETDGPVDPSSQTLVYEPQIGVMSWVDASRRDIHARFGGAGDCPVAVASPPDTLTPRDGNWRWRTLGEATAGCPADLGGMLAASRVAFMSTQVEWGGAFDPDLLSGGLPQPDVPGIAPYQWREVGPNRWISDNVQSRDCSAGVCAEIALDLSMTLMSPERISGFLSLRSAIDSPQAAIMAGFGLSECRVVVRYDFIWTGP
jgi:hypothetical protein